MNMLTKEETRWLKQLQKVLDACPSDRLGFYTVGDPVLTVYDKSLEEQIETFMDYNQPCEFGCAVETIGARFMELKFPAHVHSVSG